MRLADVLVLGHAKSARVTHLKTRTPFRFDITDATLASLKRWISHPEMIGSPTCGRTVFMQALPIYAAVRRWFGLSEQVPGVSQVVFRFGYDAAASDIGWLNSLDGGSAAKPWMRSASVVKAQTASDGCADFRGAVVGVQVDLFAYDGPPEVLGEDIVASSLFAIHADLDLPVRQNLDEVGRGDW